MAIKIDRSRISQWLGCNLGVFVALTLCLLLAPAGTRASEVPPPQSGALLIISGGGAQFEIVTPTGLRIFTDVVDPELVSSPPTARDILLTTHFDDDHFDQAFVDSFPGRHLHSRADRIQLPGLTITSIAAHHSEVTWKAMDASAGSNFLFVIDTVGMRIAHFGDIGQPEFSPAQRKSLGRVDVAITQFVNMYSQMDLENQKGYHLMEALRPKLILAHHGGGADDTIKLAIERWQVVCNPADRFTLMQSQLPKETTFLVLGEMADYMQRTFKLKNWP